MWPQSLAASKGLLLMAALYVTADALEDAREGDRFLSWLALAAAVAALAGLVQTAACPSQDPSQEPAHGLARWFFHRCDRARGFFSIYMTLAGVLNVVLLATLPRVLPGSVSRLERARVALDRSRPRDDVHARGVDRARRRARRRYSIAGGP